MNFDTSAVQAASSAIEKVGITNFKRSERHCVNFCSHCGADLKYFYGDDGGSLRDDEYVKRMKENI